MATKQMRKAIYLLVFLASYFSYSQTMTQNYVKTTNYRSAYSGYQITLDTTGTTIPPITPVNDTIKKVSISYFDGLGRPHQKIDYQQSSSLKDIVTYYEFDGMGRQVKQYLPYVRSSSSLGHVPHPMNDTYSFYNDPVGSGIGNTFAEATTNPFSESKIADSPLNEVKKTAAPGNSWAMDTGHEVKFENRYNGFQEVRFFSAVSAYSPGLEIYTPTLNPQVSYYSVNQLYKSTTWDENAVAGSSINTQEFKDKQGRVVLKRIGTENGYNDTYYVYDQFGNLSFVIPPLADTSGSISQTDLDNLCYQYLYDNENRLIEKKLPGKVWEYIVYDRQNRVVATGPAYNPFGGSETGWLITKYDGQDRVVYTGWLAEAQFSTEVRTLYKIEIYKNVGESEQWTDANLIDGVELSYTNELYPKNNILLLTINYYDNYYYVNAPAPPSQIFLQEINKYPRPLITGSWVRVLENPGEVKNEFTYYVYDKKLRLLESHKTNYLGGYTYTDNRLDFMGKVLFSHTYHRKSASVAEVFIKNNYTYSLQDHLVLHKQQINNLPEQLIVKNTYDELGQLISKNVGGTDVSGDSGLQKVDYSYNVRGWLKGINDVNDIVTENDLFAFKINYDNVENVINYTGVPLYNGNISETFWRTSSDNIKRKYGYYYDKLNRLTDAIYQKPDATFPVSNSYNESLKYDKNGNILTLNRTGVSDSPNNVVDIDQLVYVYDSNKPNQLLNVYDQTINPNGFKDGTNTDNDYTYDDHGNLISDGNKQIPLIKYNHLNLPTEIQFYYQDNTKINYLYNALGEKVQKSITVIGSGVVKFDYLDGFQYFGDVINFFPTAEGYVKNTVIAGNNNFNYAYNFTDHLGNIRLTYGMDPDTQTLKIMEENHYYPFGLKHTNYSSDLNEYGKEGNAVALRAPGNGGGVFPIPITELLKYKYKFQGQERQDELGLNWDSFKYRNYDPAIGRFMSIDPLTEEYTDWSPYVFSGNRVIDAREIEGLEPHLLNDNLQEAARNFSEQYNGYSIENSVEVATQFYQTQEGCYAYTNPQQFSPGMADPSQANDIPEGSVPVGDAHTHGSEKGLVVVQPNVTSGGPMTSEKNPIAMSKLTLNDFGTGPFQNQVVNGSNAPSGDDKQAVAHPNTGSSTFQRSYVFTPSGLSYSGGLSKDGKSIDYQINYNLSKTTPSQSNSVLNINNVPSTTTPVYIPLQGTLKLGK